MKSIYYILTTEKEIRNYEDRGIAWLCYNVEITRCSSVRLEKANAKTGTAKVIAEKNNIWK